MMPRKTLKAIILDFDGVLVESNDIKDKAFEVAFAGHPQHLPAIQEYHRRTTLIRFAKFKHIYEHILHLPYTPQVEEDLAKKFSAYCIGAVIACPWVKGAQDFLQCFYGQVPLYVISINPPRDLEEILEGRGIRHLFKGVYTAVSSKTAEILEVLKLEQCRPEEAVFVGDSRSDYESAKNADVMFVGREHGHVFKGLNVPTFPDMTGALEYLQ